MLQRATDEVRRPPRVREKWHWIRAVEEREDTQLISVFRSTSNCRPVRLNIEKCRCIAVLYAAKRFLQRLSILYRTLRRYINNVLHSNREAEFRKCRNARLSFRTRSQVTYCIFHTLKEIQYFDVHNLHTGVGNRQQIRYLLSISYASV